MYYEIYLDSFFLLQFCLNLFLLILVNNMLYHVASIKRVVGGAALGAICSMLPFLLPIKLGYCMLCSFLLAVISMSFYTFRTFQLAHFLKVFEKMLVMTLLLGGVLLFLVRLLSGRSGSFWGISGVLLLGTISYLIVCSLTKKDSLQETVCRVTLEGVNGEIHIEALMDTGNSLIEPISGEPVAVLDEQTFQELLGEKLPKMYRVIPYHSVGKSKGILKGYQLEHMTVELQGVKKECNKFYVAVSKELLASKSNYKMILNPRLLE